MIRIGVLRDTSWPVLHKAREEAFKDYPSSWTRPEYERLLHRRGYAAAYSFGAFDGDRLVSFTLNGLGQFNGVPTAYDTGTGTIGAYRGRGLAGKTFEASLDPLRAAGVRQYLLEVLVQNEPAIRVYQAQGFRTVRELHYYIQDSGQVADGSVPGAYTLSEARLAVSSIAAYSAMWDYHPSWQNSFEALMREPGDFIVVEAHQDDVICGYGIIEPASGDIPQIAVRRDCRRRGIGTAIFRALQRHNQCGRLKLINAETSCTAFTAFMASLGMVPAGMQYEMVLGLQ